MSGLTSSGNIIDTGVARESKGNQLVESPGHQRSTLPAAASAHGFVLQIGPVIEHFDDTGTTYTNGWYYGFQAYGGFGTLESPPGSTPSGADAAVIAPPSPANTETDGTTFQLSFESSSGLVTGVLTSTETIGYNLAFTYNSGSPAGTYYTNYFFGMVDTSATITIEATGVYFKPGTWQAQVTSYYESEYFPPSGSITVAGTVITTYAYGSGFSALSGATHGTFDFVVAAGGGFCTMTASSFQDGSIVGVQFTFLHA